MKLAAPIVCLSLAFAGAAFAQSYPTKPVKIIVAFTPGSATDIVSRLVADSFTRSMGQTFIVENRPGAGGIIGTEAAKNAPPDGYTLTACPSGPFGINPGIYSKLPYDPVKDFEPIATLGTVPIALVVNETSPFKSVSDLVAAAKAKPGSLTFASSGAGGPQHMSAEMFMLLTGIKMVHVPYKGNAPALTDVLGGQVDVLFSPINSALPHIRAGKLRALAVANDQRVPSLPDVPTLAEAGVPGYKSEIWIGLFAPARTPQDIIDKIAAEVARMQAQGDVKQQLAGQGIDPLGNSPAQVSNLIKADLARWAKVIKETGVKVD